MAKKKAELFVETEGFAFEIEDLVTGTLSYRKDIAKEAAVVKNRFRL